MKRLGWFVAILVLAGSALAQVRVQTVEYKHEGTVLEGKLVFDPRRSGPRPGVLVVHDWNGPDAYEEGRAKQLAELGYVALVVDIYGKGVRPKDARESAAEAGKYYQNKALLLGRARAALDFLKGSFRVNPQRIGAIGYCFGGMAVLEMARAGMDLRGVVSFHGSLGTQSRAQPGKVRAAVLVLHGDADPLVPKEDVEAIKTEMAKAAVDFKFVGYPGALHSFTVPGSERTGMAGVGYQAEADKKSWAEMMTFFRRVLGS